MYHLGLDIFSCKMLFHKWINTHWQEKIFHCQSEMQKNSGPNPPDSASPLQRELQALPPWALGWWSSLHSLPCQVSGGMSWWETYAQKLPDPRRNPPRESGATLEGAPGQWELHRNPLWGHKDRHRSHTCTFPCSPHPADSTHSVPPPNQWAWEHCLLSKSASISIIPKTSMRISPRKKSKQSNFQPSRFHLHEINHTRLERTTTTSFLVQENPPGTYFL